MKLLAKAPDVAQFAIGATDCEAIHDDLFAQPVNAYTSFGYVAVGLTLVGRGLKKGRHEGSPELLYGSTLVAIGFGSVIFHGPQPASSQFVHDVPIAAALLYIFLYNLNRLNDFEQVNRLFGLGLIPLAVAFAVAPTLTQIVAASLAGAAIVTEVLVYRSSGPGRVRNLDKIVAGLLILAGAGYILGRTGSTLCDPDSLWQLHGVWHLLSAAAFMLWGLAAFDETKKSTVVGSHP